VQLGASRRCTSAATAAIGGWDAHETVGPSASPVVSLVAARPFWDGGFERAWLNIVLDRPASWR